MSIIPSKLKKRIEKEIWLLKEGAVVGLIVGLIIYYVPIPWALAKINDWFGPFLNNQMLFTTLFLTVSAGIIFDCFYKPGK